MDLNLSKRFHFRKVKIWKKNERRDFFKEKSYGHFYWIALDILSHLLDQKTYIIFFKTFFFSIDIDICFLPRETGYCRAYFPRFYYNSKVKSCRKFIYGGCGNQIHGFWICFFVKLPLPGHCFCIPHFCCLYCLVGGNPNSFDTKEECVERCGQKNITVDFK